MNWSNCSTKRKNFLLFIENCLQLCQLSVYCKSIIEKSSSPYGEAFGYGLLSLNHYEKYVSSQHLSRTWVILNVHIEISKGLPTWNDYLIIVNMNPCMLKKYFYWYWPQSDWMHVACFISWCFNTHMKYGLFNETKSMSNIAWLIHSTQYCIAICCNPAILSCKTYLWYWRRY